MAGGRSSSSCRWAVTVAAVAVGLFAHGVHASLTSIDYNSESKSLEITMVMTADDVEAAIRKVAGKAVEVDTPEGEKLVYAYVAEKLQIRNRAGAPLKLKWVGQEVRTAKLTAYLEAPLPEGPAGLKIRDDLLFELLPDQVNMLAVKRDHKGKSSDHLFQAAAAGAWQTVAGVE